MFSIIVCHRNIDFLERFKLNVERTIGLPFEFVIIDNKKNQYNIFQAYNEGIEKSQFEIICFAHEDIFFETNNWGEIALSHFSDPNVGIIGVAGSHYLPKMPGAWWSTGISSMNIKHQIGKEIKCEISKFFKTEKQYLSAIILDGLWLCARKSSINSIRFDDISYSGFHLYDSDICMQILKQGLDVRIVYDIAIIHFSQGCQDQKWVENSFIFYKKWKGSLPLLTQIISKEEKSNARYANALEMIYVINRSNSPSKYLIKLLLTYISCIDFLYLEDSKKILKFVFITIKSYCLRILNFNRLLH